MVGDHAYVLAAAGVAAPLCVWLGLGLRADGEAGEVADLLIQERPRFGDWLGVENNLISVSRVSTFVIVLGLSSLVVAILHPPEADHPARHASIDPGH